jgi:putative oxidoreductase
MATTTDSATAVGLATGEHATTGVLAWIDHPHLGRFLLRAMVSVLLLFHGLNFAEGDSQGIQMTALAKIGIPSAIGLVIGYLLEIICPILALLGVYARAAALGMAIFMASAILLFWVPREGLGVFFKMSPANMAGMFNPYFLETQFFYLLGALAIVFLGAGKYGLNIGGRWNN